MKKYAYGILLITAMLIVFESCEDPQSVEMTLEQKLQGRWEFLDFMTVGYLRINGIEWFFTSAHPFVCPSEELEAYVTNTTCNIEYVSEDQIRLYDCIEEIEKNCIDEGKMYFTNPETYKVIFNPELFGTIFSEKDGRDYVEIGGWIYYREL